MPLIKIFHSIYSTSAYSSCHSASGALQFYSSAENLLLETTAVLGQNSEVDIANVSASLVCRLASIYSSSITECSGCCSVRTIASCF